MDAAEAEARVIRAVDQLLHHDAYLLEHDVNERSITHRLAVHLAAEFAGWDVDCEYNRDRHKKKTLGLPKKSDISSDDEHATTVFPDIIVHHRGPNGENLVVIEAKKTTNSDDGGWDRRKLEAFADPDELGYKVTVFLLLETRSRHEAFAIVEFADGRKVRRPPAP